MQKQDPYLLLNQRILETESEQKTQAAALKEQFRATYESLKPINIIKNTFKQAAISPDLRSQVANTALGLGAGFLVKKLFGGDSKNPLIKLVGTMLGSFIGSKVENNADGIKSAGSFLVSKIKEEYNTK